MTNYNNAYQQMLNTNQQNFGQQQQNYQNKTDYDQSQISNYGNLANVGLNATTSLQGLLGNYNSAINQDYQNQAASRQQGWNDKAGIFNKTATGLGNNLGGGIMSIFGSK